MAKDIVPELLEKIENEFKNKTSKSKILKEKMEDLKNKKVSHKDSNTFAVELGKLLSETFNDEISADILPDNKMYYNIAKRLIEPNLANNYGLVSNYSMQVQEILNKESKIRIRAVKPELNQDRINGIVNKISEYDDFKKGKWLLKEPVINFTQAVVDDTIKVNADFQYKAGLRPEIIRKEFGNCCDWCKDVVGKYNYPDVPEDVYKRHRYCRCTVEYLPGNGKKRDVWSKKWTDVEKDDKIKERKRKDYADKIVLNKSIKGANKIAKQMGFNADYSGIDVKCANEWNLGLFNAKQRFPEVAKKIKFVGSSQKRNALMRKVATEYYEKKFIDQGITENKAIELAKKYGKRIIGNVGSNNMASSINEEALTNLPEELRDSLMPYMGITMNNRYFNEYGKVIESGLQQVKSKWRPERCFNVKATFDHEFAHQIDGYLNLREVEKIQKLFDERTFEEITRDLSKYSWNNNNPDKYSEMIAEGWSEYCNNEKPRELAKIIGDEIIKLWKNKNI
ncbi:MAG: hypothetical protein Q4E28_04935 [Clostridia bacterium]|nr:hypothetical protein [Clostridia bacterium]